MEFSGLGSVFGQFRGPYGIAIDSKDNIYVIETDGERVRKFDKDWNFITAWGTSGTGAGEFRNPWYADTDSHDNLYIVDASNNRIQKFDSDGNFLHMWGRRGDGPGQFIIPYEVAIDSNDRIYVADSTQRIQVFDSDGNLIYSWDAPENYSVKSVSVDSDGFVYVSNLRRAQVIKLPPFPLN